MNSVLAERGIVDSPKADAAPFIPRSDESSVNGRMDRETKYAIFCYLEGETAGEEGILSNEVRRSQDQSMGQWGRRYEETALDGLIGNKLI